MPYALSNMNDEFFKRDTDVARIDTGDESSEPGSTSLRDAIRENALGPKKVASDAGSVEQHSLQDQIAAERFLASKETTRKPGLGIRLTKLSPDGTT
jgi:hypothetical protein